MYICYVLVCVLCLVSIWHGYLHVYSVIRVCQDCYLYLHELVVCTSYNGASLAVSAPVDHQEPAERGDQEGAVPSV